MSPGNRFSLADLPRELIEEVAKHMDTLSRVRLRKTCVFMRDIVEAGFMNQVCLHEFGDVHRFLKLDEFVEHILLQVSNGILDEKKYFMVRCENCSIIFCRIRRGSKNSYKVRIENDNLTIMRLSYDCRRRTIFVDKTIMDPIEVPQMLFALGIRFLMNVYKYRKLRYNFEQSFVPEHLRKMMTREYNGNLLKEVILENFFIS